MQQQRLKTEVKSEKNETLLLEEIKLEVTTSQAHAKFWQKEAIMIKITIMCVKLFKKVQK